MLSVPAIKNAWVRTDLPGFEFHRSKRRISDSSARERYGSANAVPGLFMAGMNLVAGGALARVTRQS